MLYQNSVTIMISTSTCMKISSAKRGRGGNLSMKWVTRMFWPRLVATAMPM